MPLTKKQLDKRTDEQVLETLWCEHYRARFEWQDNDCEECMEHEKVQTVPVGLSVYYGKNWGRTFKCPDCERQARFNLNFLGQRKVFCNGIKFTKERV